MGSKYQAYPEYKDSGVEWIGSIPKNWSVSKLGYLINTIVPMRDKPTSLEGEIPWIRIEDFDGKYISSSKSGQGVTESTINEFNLKVFPVGTVLCTCSCSMGTTAIVARPLISNQTFIGLLPGEKLDSEYLYYLMQASEAELTSKSAGAIQKYLSQDEFKALRFGFPSLNEQRIIANFLDHETARIDTLIEKQRQLIKLLKEKRQAVISHAVTKGLNPNAKMRDSGVEWLGEVPEHWVVAQLKFNTLEMQTGPFGSQLHAEDYVDDGIPLVNPAHMTEGKIVPDSKVSVDHETWNRLSRHQLFEGDLIFARRGELGRCAVITKGEEGWLCGTGSLKAKLNERLIPEYSYLLITSDGVVSELSLESKGSTMDNLNTETLGRVRLPVPPTVEQKKILSYVKEVSGKYDCLIDKASSTIGLMQERRTALISAAVTGKIDVRDWQAPNG